jgi:hypothetical protein
MGSRAREPKNRFLPGAHVSELTLTRILFCWLRGDLYSVIPDAISERGDTVDAGIESLRMLMGDRFQLAENRVQRVSRQTCHSIISEISLQIIVRNYKDRITYLDHLLSESDPHLKTEKRRVLKLIGSIPTDDEKSALLEAIKNQTVQDYVTKWGKIVFILSADVVPHSAMRAIEGVKPFDLIQNPVILEKMQQRYRAFRGYKIPALKTHIAHYFALRNGADFLLRDEHGPAADDLHRLRDHEKAEYWLRCVTRSLACLLLELQTGMTYLQLREELWRQS